MEINNPSSGPHSSNSYKSDHSDHSDRYLPIQTNPINQDIPSLTPIPTPTQNPNLTVNPTLTPGIDTNLLNSNDISLNDLKVSFEKKEKEYIAKIKELEYELQKENNQLFENKQEINESTLQKLRQELNDKEKILKKYIKINTSQRNELENLSKEIDKKLKNISLKSLSDKLKQEKIQKMGQKNPENIIKIKENQLKNALTLVDILTKDNKRLKNEYNNANDSQGKYDLIDKAKKYDLIITNLNVEINKYKRLVEEHLKCDRIKGELDKKLLLARNEKENCVNKILDVNNKIKQFDEMYNKGLKVKEILKEEQTKKNLLKKDTSGNSNKESNVISLYSLKNDPDYPIISSIFTEQELSMLISAYTLENTTNKKEFQKLIKKIVSYYTQRNTRETQHKLDIKNHENKIKELNEQIDFINKKNESNENELKLLNCQISDYQNDQKTYNRKIKEMKNLIDSTKVLNSQKDNEIVNLNAQLEEVKNVFKNYQSTDQMNQELNKYIMHIKNGNNN